MQKSQVCTISKKWLHRSNKMWTLQLSNTHIIVIARLCQKTSVTVTEDSSKNCQPACDTCQNNKWTLNVLHNTLIWYLLISTNCNTRRQLSNDKVTAKSSQGHQFFVKSIVKFATHNLKVHKNCYLV